MQPGTVVLQRPVTTQPQQQQQVLLQPGSVPSVTGAFQLRPVQSAVAQPAGVQSPLSAIQPGIIQRVKSPIVQQTSVVPQTILQQGPPTAAAVPLPGGGQPANQPKKGLSLTVCILAFFYKTSSVHCSHP